MPNFTDVTEFILLGLTSHQDLQVLFFGVFLVVYIITLLGNIGMIVLISIIPQLQSPMYFFLMCSSLPMSPPKCWKTYYQRKKPFSMWGVWCSVTFSLPLSMWKSISWQWWPLIATWPSATLCFTEVKCPGLSVFGSFLCLMSMDSLLV